MHDLTIIWAMPFFMVLLSVAICPVLFSGLWKDHSFKILLSPILVFIVTGAFKYGAGEIFVEVFHTLIVHYIPLMAILCSLFVVTGGIYVKIDKKATPILNCKILCVGSLLAGWIGTTGASMLLIRPLLAVNANRKHKVHIIVFFIFLVSNVGGALTPLGDPPLFVGFLEGVDFFWTLKNLALMLFVIFAALLSIFYVLDTYFIKKDHVNVGKYTKQISVDGGINICLMLLIIFFTAIVGFLNLGEIDLAGEKIKIVNLLKDMILFCIAYVSYKFTPKKIRQKNNFSGKPFIEVMEIFFAIFIALIPVSGMLKMGPNGAFDWVFNWVNSNGAIDPFRVFWACGIMSSVLDNAPSYLMFFNLSGGDPLYLMGAGRDTLIAISTSSVFMGAMTYIGNAPNLMVKSIAEESCVDMPDFIGYLCYSCACLLPLLVIFSYFVFA